MPDRLFLAVSLWRASWLAAQNTQAQSHALDATHAWGSLNWHTISLRNGVRPCVEPAYSPRMWRDPFPAKDQQPTCFLVDADARYRAFSPPTQTAHRRSMQQRYFSTIATRRPVGCTNELPVIT
jgi:hypothetical protein